MEKTKKQLSDFILINSKGFNVFSMDLLTLFLQLNHDKKDIILIANSKTFEFKKDEDFSIQFVKFLDDSGCLEELKIPTYFSRNLEYSKWLELNEGLIAR